MTSLPVHSCSMRAYPSTMTEARSTAPPSIESLAPFAQPGMRREMAKRVGFSTFSVSRTAPCQG